MLCSYGCGLESKFQTKGGKYCCSPSWASCSETKRKISETLKKRLKA